MNNGKRFLKQVTTFVGISGIGWCLDFVAYVILNFWNTASHANFFSATIGVSFVFWVSTRHAFKNKADSMALRYKYIIYLIYQIAAIWGASFAIGWLQTVILRYATFSMVISCSHIISKILVTPFTMALNFFAMKLLIEKV